MFSGTRSNNKKSLRLYPSELNHLIEAEGVRRHGELITIPITNAVSSFDQLGFACYRVASGEKIFFMFNVIKDSVQRDNEPNLPNFAELLRVLKDDERFLNCTLLMPMRQCRGFLRMPESIKATKREHIVLVEVDIFAKKISVHDSQSVTKYRAYPDDLDQVAKKLGFEYKYYAYDIQKDDVLCGYYVHQYMRALMDNVECRLVSMPLHDLPGNVIFSLPCDHAAEGVKYCRGKEEYMTKFGVAVSQENKPDSDPGSSDESPSI